MLGPCEAKDGTNIDELLQAGASGHKRAWQDVRRNSDSRKTAGSLPKRPKIGRLKEKRGELHGRKKEDCQRSLRWENSRHRKVFGVSPKRKYCRTEVHFLRKKVYKALHEEHFLSSWLREVGEEKEQIIMDIGKETKEEMGKKRRREEEKEENETVFVKRRCVGSVSVEPFDIFILWLIGL